MSDRTTNENLRPSNRSPLGYNIPHYNPIKNHLVEEIKNLCSTHNENWGSIIHNDNTVKLNQEFIFNNKKRFFSAWNRVKTLKGSSANIETLTITIGSYPHLEVYLNSNPMEEE